MSPISERIVKILAEAIKIIDKSNLQFIEYGIFGSVARGDYTGVSDVDIVIITDKPLSSKEFCDIKHLLEQVDCDVANITREHFVRPISAFHKNVVKDYRRIKYGK